MIKKLTSKVLNRQDITQMEALKLSQIPDKKALYAAADKIRQHFCGNEMDLCSITNARSGRCTQDCQWCAQSIHHTSKIEEYDMVEKQRAVSEALNAARQGVKRHSLVTAGRKVSNTTLEQLIPIYKEISRKTPLHLCASMGLISEEQMRRLKEEAGVEHYHCNIETAPSFFTHLVSTHGIEEKINTIKLAQKVGLKVCSGGIIGMGESMAQRIEMALTLRTLNILSIPINILQPIKGTALEQASPLSEEDILTTIAIFRFINPTAKLRFAGGRMQIKSFQDKALRAGINAALTGDYLTSTGANIQEDIQNFTQAGFKVKTNESE